MPEKPLSALMREAQATSERYHKLANQVSARVTEFDAWLAALPGKVAVEKHTANPNYNPDYNDYKFLVVGIQRVGKDWCLALAEASESEDPDFVYSGTLSWKPVRDASLTLKSAALKVLPDLVEDFLADQKSLIGVMNEVPHLEQGGK